MKNIHLISLDKRAHLVQPDEFNELSLSSPLREIFTDFKKHKPLIIDSDTYACDAFYLMGKTHVGLLLVVDKANELVGSISYDELNEQQFMIKQKQGFDRHQLKVDDLMIKRANMKGLDYKLLDMLSIDDFVELLKLEGMKYCLVTDPENDQIRGVISARDVSSRLHINVDIQGPQTFADIFVAVNGNQHKQYSF